LVESIGSRTIWGMATEDSENDRRTSERHLTCYPAHLEENAGNLKIALIHDLSVTGAMLLTRGTLTVGEELKLHLYIAEDGTKAREVSAEVVRVGLRDADVADLWTHNAAVRFLSQLTEHADEISALAERQAETLEILNARRK